MVAVAIVAVPISCWRAYRQAIPKGVDFFPYYMASVEGPRLVSLDGRRVVQIVYNDAGAMHSGLHWTWLIQDELWGGKRVVGEGYTGGPGDSTFRVEWLDERTLRLEFYTHRHTENKRSTVITLD